MREREKYQREMLERNIKEKCQREMSERERERERKRERERERERKRNREREMTTEAHSKKKKEALLYAPDIPLVWMTVLSLWCTLAGVHSLCLCVVGVGPTDPILDHLLEFIF